MWEFSPKSTPTQTSHDANFVVTAVVVFTAPTSGATSEYKVGIVTLLDFQIDMILKYIDIKVLMQYDFVLNSLWPCDIIRRYRSGSTLAQVMACCLTAPSHYLNQCWLIISDVLWYSPLSNLTVSARATILYNKFQKYIFKITATSPRDQWVIIVETDVKVVADSSNWQ